MRLTLLPLLAFTLVLFFQSPADAQSNSRDMYPTKYDDINLDEILNNKRLFRKYFECLAGGRCTPEGREVRDVIPEALATNCRKCSEKQIQGANKIIAFVRKNKPEEFKVLQRIYDPKGIYSAQAGIYDSDQ